MGLEFGGALLSVVADAGLRYITEADSHSLESRGYIMEVWNPEYSVCLCIVDDIFCDNAVYSFISELVQFVSMISPSSCLIMTW